MNLFSELLFLISEHLIKGIFISVLVIIGAKVLSGIKLKLRYQSKF